GLIVEDPEQDQESHRRRAGLGCSSWTAPTRADLADWMNAEDLCRSWLVVQVSLLPRTREPMRSSEVATTTRPEDAQPTAPAQPRTRIATP
ncbi:hypothetical protein, partial [Mesorhizobium sp. M2A.F.Ca.ET.017.03.2.1]|uniref:hypothetical protein n=1 Tax=Mesorhizobium sp. M2A.F.Ca.ET.017.03.2.1 TaxID=2496650 RepID=UPI001AEC7A63